MAVNFWVVPLAMLGLVGVIAMDTSVAGVTVRVVDPDMLPDVAVIVVDPVATGGGQSIGTCCVADRCHARVG